MTWILYMLTPNGKRHDLARTVSVSQAAELCTLVNNVLLIVDGVGEVKYEEEKQ